MDNKQQNKPSPPSPAPMTKDQRKQQAISYLMAAKKSYPKESQATQIRVAIVRFILDELGEDDKAVRKNVATAFLETPAWFGASANAMQECPDYVKRVEATAKEFLDI